MPIFRVKSVTIYTGQKKFTQAPLVVLVTNIRYDFSQQDSHLIFMAISSGQLNIGEQKMVLLIAGVSSQDQPEKESMSCQPELVRLGCMPRLETSW